MASTPNTWADAVRQERLRRRNERDWQQRAEETAENSDWLVCAAIRLDCSFSLSIITLDVRLPMPDIDREAPTQIIVFGLYYFPALDVLLF